MGLVLTARLVAEGVIEQDYCYVHPIQLPCDVDIAVELLMGIQLISRYCYVSQPSNSASLH